MFGSWVFNVNASWSYAMAMWMTIVAIDRGTVIGLIVCSVSRHITALTCVPSSFSGCGFHSPDVFLPNPAYPCNNRFTNRSLLMHKYKG